MTIKIIGSGMAGLLAANMLRHRDPVIIEKQPELPNNHSAVLRFRSPIVGDVLNVPFKKVTMIKAHVPWRNPVADALAYSFKNGNTYRSDRSIIAGTTVADRWIAPKDLISIMARRCNIEFNSVFQVRNDNVPIISTIPMPTLMLLLDYPERNNFSFNFQSGLNFKATVKDCDAYVSILVPDPEVSFSRASITGDELVIEFPNRGHLTNAKVDLEMEDLHTFNKSVEMLGVNLFDVGRATVHRQLYSKIYPVDDAARKNFMHWATDKFNIFSLGRFATWRPGLLLDDLVQDIRKIDRWLSDGKYSIAKER